MLCMHLRPEIALEPWLMEAAQTIFERLQPYVKQDHADELFTHTSRAIRTALAPYLYSNDMCTLTATSREGERPSIGPTAVDSVRAAWEHVGVMGRIGISPGIQGQRVSHARQ